VAAYAQSSLQAPEPVAGTVPGAGGGREETLTRRRVYILPTRYGATFYAVLAVMLIGSINYNNSLGYSLTFLLGSLGLVAMLHTYRNLAGLVLRASCGPPVFAGGQAAFRLHADNRSGGERPDLLIRYTDYGLDGVPRPVLARTGLAAGALARVELAVHAPRRGRLELGRVVIATRYPLGLFRAWSVLALEAVCVVYPRPAGRRELPAGETSSLRDGGSSSRGTDDFAGLRRYLPGDSSRQIHWKAVAREQEIPVKVFAGASANGLVLRWHDTPGTDTEARLSQLCRWVLEAEARGIRYALELPGERLPAGLGGEHRERALRVLALHGEGRGEGR